MEEEAGEITLEAEEEVMSEVNIVAVLKILVEEVKTQTLVSQVVTEPTNQRFNAISVKIMDIMHMSARRNSIIRISNVKITLKAQIVPPVLCFVVRA
jgi:glutaminase